MCMNRIMLIIEYMNAIYALKNWIINFILQLAHFVYEYSVVICVCYTIFLWWCSICWCSGRVIQRYFALYPGSLLKDLIMQARFPDFMLEDTLRRRTFWIYLFLLFDLLIYFTNMRGGWIRTCYDLISSLKIAQPLPAFASKMWS